jgi:hypothetical protein
LDCSVQDQWFDKSCRSAPTGKGGFVKGQSGNPGGRRRYLIGDFSVEARKFGRMALETVVDIMQKGQDRNRLVAAREILDRACGRSVQAVDVLTVEKRLSELAIEELTALNARIVSSGLFSSSETTRCR